MNSVAPSTGTLARFGELDAFLLAHQALWRPRPFTCLRLPWEADHPDWSAWLRARSLDDAERIGLQGLPVDAPPNLAQLATRAAELSRLDELPASTRTTGAPRQSVDVPGRKWEQIQAFAGRLGFTEPPRHWLDWCAGKGHLGRLVAYPDTPLTCLEWDAALVAEGERLSRRLNIAASHRQQDVMAENAATCLEPGHTPIALHACGDLHVRLMELAMSRGCRQLAIAPCCYNRIEGDRYQPLSQAARRSALTLSRDDLGLPLSETVTAGARERRQRDQSMAWRLGFDLLQRRLRGIDSYLPTPSLPSAWLRKPFAQYCRDLASLKNLGNVDEQDWNALEDAGWQRLAQVRNLETVRNLFRRPLELWLLLDRALRLEESGYRVRLGTFCPPSLTPRNLLLLAERP
ncbi:SAM-dependent methyltransferase [Stutzerimonas nosocomialis]|nr:methyltransferase [Stutzerimonas nosocomialis]TLX58930.1 SAM-dependent methyltransferase [Stutzerimonas nosocomialis]